MVYTKDFREEAIELVRRGRFSITEAAAHLGINRWTLREWVRIDPMARKRMHQQTKKSPKEAASEQVDVVNESPKEELARLRRENAQLRREKASLEMDKAILKKAAAFFAKESE